MPKEKRYVYSAVAALIGISIIISSGIFSQIYITGATFWSAIHDCLYYTIFNPFGFVLLLAPYAVVGWFSGKQSETDNSKNGLILFWCGLLPLAPLYLKGFISSQHCMINEAWTCATLSIGILPFYSVPVASLGYLVGWGILKLLKKT